MATITTAEARKISSLPKPSGRLMLLEFLKWDLFDEDKDMQRSIHLDFLYDNLMFAVNKGFSWDKVVTVFDFGSELLSEIKECENITDILGFYKVKSMDLCSSLGQREYKIFTEYIFNTILPHFKLIRLVFTTARKEQIPHVTLTVDPPFEPGVLKQSKGINVWEYEKRIEELDKKAAEKTNEKLVEKGKQKAEMEQKTTETLDTAVKDKPMDKDSIMKIIQEVTTAYSQAATETMKANINDLKEDLEHKLEKTSLPRPQALGPPPRYNVATGLKPKTPVSAARSPKPGSRASTKAKKK